MPPPPASSDLKNHTQLSVLEVTTQVSAFLLHLHTKFQVCRPSRSEHMGDFRSQR